MSEAPTPERKAGRASPRTTLARALTRALGALPLGANRALGTLAGNVLRWTRGRPWRVARTNIELCFPELSAQAKRALVRDALREQGRAFAELGWIWHRPLPELRAKVVETVGAELLAASLARGRGTMLVTPHFGGWELGLVAPGHTHTIGYFYRPPRDRALEPLLVEGRGNLDGDPLRLDGAGIRDALRRLAAGRSVGILPDQEPDRDGGVFAPFFGTPALTMTLLSRLAAKSGCDVLFVGVERLPGGTGWRYRYIAPVGDVAAKDIVVAATALNRSVEACVRVNPAQYLWSYRRFRELPEGGRRNYR